LPASFAIELARNGARVVLLERTHRPTLKVCGDFLSGEAVDFLSYLGLDPGDVGAVPVDTLIRSSGTKTAKAALPFPAAGLSRTRLDEALLARATSHGVEVIRGVSATALRLEAGLATVATEGVTFRGKSAALATGKHNLRGKGRPVRLQPSRCNSRLAGLPAPTSPAVSRLPPSTAATLGHV
jgi:flavin-dependent dehydrogenase